MDIKDQINQMSETEVLKTFKDFSNHLMQTTGITPVRVKQSLDPALKEITEIDDFAKSDSQSAMSSLETAEAIAVARGTLLVFADNPDYSEMLKDFLSNYKNREMFAGATILALGGVLTMIIAATSIKVEKKDGKVEWGYGSANISDNAVELVKSLLSLMPDAVIKLTTKTDKD